MKLGVTSATTRGISAQRAQTEENAYCATITICLETTLLTIVQTDLPFRAVPEDEEIDEVNLNSSIIPEL